MRFAHTPKWTISGKPELEPEGEQLDRTRMFASIDAAGQEHASLQRRARNYASSYFRILTRTKKLAYATLIALSFIT